MRCAPTLNDSFRSKPTEAQRFKSIVLLVSNRLSSNIFENSARNCETKKVFSKRKQFKIPKRNVLKNSNIKFATLPNKSMTWCSKHRSWTNY